MASFLDELSGLKTIPQILILRGAAAGLGKLGSVMVKVQ